MSYFLVDNCPKDCEHKKIGKITKLVKWCMDNNLPILARILHEKRKVTCGDMFWGRDELSEAGFKLWKDFSIKKIDDGE